MGPAATQATMALNSSPTADSLVTNNIFQKVVAPMMVHSDQGSVYSYNYTINNTYDDGGKPLYHWMSPGISGGHSGGGMYTLLEGNISSAIHGRLLPR